MKLIFTSYTQSPEFDQPQSWLRRIKGYTGILESLARFHTVISIEHIAYEGRLEQAGVTYHFLPLKKKVEQFPLRLHRLIKQLQPDTVFINGFIFPLQIIQLRLWLGRSVQVIVLHRAEKPFNGIKKYLQRLADRCVNGYLFTSSEFGAQWNRNGNIANPRKIYEVVQASSFFYPADKQEAQILLSVTGSPVYLWVGRLDANKDPLTVIKAFTRFGQVCPGASLYMIYQQDDLLPQVTALLQSDPKKAIQVRLVGKVAHNELQNWYNGADFILSSSHYEGSGVAVCEAMSCGCIPVLTDIISFRRMTGPGKCGLLYAPGNAAELCDALLKTVSLDREKERLYVLQQFRDELSFDAIAAKIQRVIGSV